MPLSYTYIIINNLIWNTISLYFRRITSKLNYETCRNIIFRKIIWI